MSDQQEDTGDKTRYFNTTDTPFRMDQWGHTLGGGEEGEFVHNRHVQYGLEQGWLIDRDQLEKDTAAQSEAQAQSENRAAEHDSNGGTPEDDSDAVQRNQPKSSQKRSEKTKAGSNESQEK
jgi:hypothetical protein